MQLVGVTRTHDDCMPYINYALVLVPLISTAADGTSLVVQCVNLAYLGELEQVL